MSFIVQVIHLIKDLTVSDWVAVVSMVVSICCAVATYRLRNSTLQQVKGTHNQVFNNCTVTHTGDGEIYPDHAVAELSSRVLADRTRNFLKLTEKTLLALPQMRAGDVLDLVLRIDVGEKVFPLGIDTKGDHFDIPGGRDNLVQLVPHSRLYLLLTGYGCVENDGVHKRNWMLVSQGPFLDVEPSHRQKPVSYGRIVNGNLVRAKNWLEIGGVVWWNPTSEMFVSQGYKLVDERGPGSAEKGFHYESPVWEDCGETIVRRWKLVKDELPPQELEYEMIQTLVTEVNDRFDRLRQHREVQSS